MKVKRFVEQDVTDFNVGDIIEFTMSDGEYRVHYKRYTGDVIDLYNRIYGNMFSTENVTKEQANSVYRKVTEDLKYAD